MKVIEIKVVGRGVKRKVVFESGGERQVFESHRDSVAAFSLLVGGEFDESVWREFRGDSERRLALDAALSRLDRRAHSEKELRRKLSGNFSGRSIDWAMDELKRLGFIDDAAFAARFAESKSFCGWGPFKIRVELRRRGVEQSIIDGCLGEMDESAVSAVASVVFERKMKSLTRETDIRKRRAKLFRFMLGRGFPAETISRLWDGLGAES